MSREVIHLEPPKVPLLGKPEEVRAGNLTEETEDKDREKEEKEKAFEALYNNRKDVKGEVKEGKGRGGEDKGGKVWKRWVVGGVVGLVVVGGVMIGVNIREQGTGNREQGATVAGDRDTSDKSIRTNRTDMNSWYAVHLADGKVYYGRLSKVETEYPELTQVFYEQAQTNADRPRYPTGQARTNADLTRTDAEGVGSEVKGGLGPVRDQVSSGNSTAVQGQPVSNGVKEDKGELKEVKGTTTMGELVGEDPDAGKVGAGNGGKIVLVKLGTEVSRPEDRLVINKQNLLYYERLSADSPIVKAIRGYLGRK